MNPDTREQAKAISSSVARKAKAALKTTVVIAPPAPFLRDVVGASGKSAHRAHGAAQDVSENAAGAFTGSVSARQLRSAGGEYAIIGHSERRKAGDTDAIVAQKAAQAADAGLLIILCVGETERDANARYLQTVRAQILAVMGVLDKKLARRIVIAYEPVWAIGKSYDTAPKPSDIHEMTIYIRKIATEALGTKDGLKVPVLYGGSVDFENAKAILRE